jgi:hypothetical protein
VRHFVAFLVVALLVMFIVFIGLLELGSVVFWDWVWFSGLRHN